MPETIASGNGLAAARPATQPGMVVIWERSSGKRLERWPVDARELLATGSYTTEELKEAVAPVEPASPPSPPQGHDVGAGYRVEQANTWWTLYGPDGKKVGSAKRSREEALAQMPVSPTGAPLKVATGGELGALVVPEI